MVGISENTFNFIGLTEQQAKVYLAALELGQGTMQELSRKSGVKRTTIYTFIDELREKGLITETKKKKRRFYSAVHPESLVELEKTRLAELQRVLPELLAFYNKSLRKPRVTFYEGIEGIEEVYADMLKEKTEIIAYEDLEHMKVALPKSFYEYFPPERARRGIPFKSITRDTPTSREFAKNNIRLLRETKFIQSDDLKTEINIYGNKVALMSFRSRPPFCVLIEDAAIAQTLKVVWRQLWDRLGPVTG